MKYFESLFDSYDSVEDNEDEESFVVQENEEDLDSLLSEFDIEEDETEELPSEVYA